MFDQHTAVDVQHADDTHFGSTLDGPWRLADCLFWLRCVTAGQPIGPTQKQPGHPADVVESKSTEGRVGATQFLGNQGAEPLDIASPNHETSREPTQNE